MFTTEVTEGHGGRRGRKARSGRVKSGIDEGCRGMRKVDAGGLCYLGAFALGSAGALT